MSSSEFDQRISDVSKRITERVYGTGKRIVAPGGRRHRPRLTLPRMGIFSRIAVGAEALPVAIEIRFCFGQGTRSLQR